jgi:hypothetical protein
VHDPCLRRYHSEVVERLLAPAKEGVSFLIALELSLGVDHECGGGTVFVHLDGMVDHQLGRLERIDLARIPAHLTHRVTQCGQIDHCGHAGEVLQQNAGRHESDLGARRRFRLPAGQCLDISGRHRQPVLEPQEVLEKNPQAVRQSSDRIPGIFERIQPRNPVLAAPDSERPAT